MDRQRPAVVVLLFALLCHRLCAAAWLGGYFDGRGFLNNHEDEEDIASRDPFRNFDVDGHFEEDPYGDALYGRVVPPLDPFSSEHDHLHGRNDYHGPGHFGHFQSDYDHHFGDAYNPNRFTPPVGPHEAPNPDLNVLRNVFRDMDNFHSNLMRRQQVPLQEHISQSFDSASDQFAHEDGNSTNYSPCYLLPKSRQTSNPGISTRLIRGMTLATPATDTGSGSEEFDVAEDMASLSNLLDIANQMYGFDLDGLLDENDSESGETIAGNQEYNVKEDIIPILHRRKRSPQPRRSSSSSRSSSSRSSSRSRSRSSGSSGSRSSSGSRWSWGSRSSPSRSSSSGGSSSRSSSSRDSSTRRVSTGTAVVGGAAVAGAGVGVATSGSRNAKPSAPPLESSPTSGYGSGGSSSSGSVYPTSGGTASAPYPTAGRPTAGAPYPTSGSSYPTSGGYPTAGAPYPTAGAPYPTAGAPYPTSGGRPTAGAPYPTAGAPYPTAGAPYPTAGAPYPSSAGRPIAGAPYPTYPTASAPYPTSGVRPTAGSPYPTAGAPYPPGRGYPTASAPYPPSYPSAYPTSGTRYPTSATHYPGVNAYPGASYPGSHYSNNFGRPTHGNFPQPKKSKSKKVKQVVKAAIAGYVAHKAAKKARKGLFSPSLFSHRRNYYHSSSFGHGFGHGGYGHGYGRGFGGSGMGTAAAAAVGGKVAKKILGAYVKIQIAKYALKFGAEAAKIYFYHKLGYNLRDEAIDKFIRRYQNRGEQRRRLLRLRGAALNSTLPFNITAGEDCARSCRDNDTRLCLFTFKVHLYQTLTRACYDCPRNLTDCLRPECIFGAGERRLLTVVNRQLPGPAIEVCHNDRVLVEVLNDLPSAGVTLHWHGLTMDSDQFMDGVGGLTQCPIQPRETFTYSFKANFPGTHYWHAQDGLLRGEGLYGPLIVRKPDEYEPNKFFYDHDLTAHVLTISDLPSRTSEAQFAERFFNEDTPPATNLLINGRAGTKEGSKATLPYARIDVEKDKRYRIRVINAASLNCPVRLVAPAGHNFTVIATDGANIAAFYTHSLVVYNGERWDVVLTADQTPGRYWLTVLGEVECEGRSQNVVVSYKTNVPDPLLEVDNNTAAGNSSGGTSSAPNATLSEEDILNVIEDTELPTEEPITEDTSVLRANTFAEDCSSPNVTCLDEMLSLVYSPLPDYMAEPLVEDTIFLGFGAQPLYNSHFYSLLYYGPEFMPPAKRSKTPQVNNLSLRLPAKPLLMDSNPPRRSFCNAAGVRRKNCVGDYCECLHSEEIEHGRVVELVLVNEGLKNETLPQPVHLHGYRFWVLSQVVYDANSTANGTSADAVDTSTPAASPASDGAAEEPEEDALPESPDSDGFTRLKALNLFSRDQLKRNFFHPIMKDTIMIPPGGYAIVRFHAQNNGYWLGESQVLLQAAGGQGFVLQVGNRTQLPRLPKGFPTC